MTCPGEWSRAAFGGTVPLEDVDVVLVAAAESDLGSVPGSGMYLMIVSRSERSDGSVVSGWSVGCFASDHGVGLGTSVTVVSVSGVGCVTVADNDL